MPTAERYALNELQQAVLDVLAASSGEVTRAEIIERVVAIPGMDDVTGNHLGPCLAALKRRELAKTVCGGGWYITVQGLEYVDQEEGEGSEVTGPLEPAWATPIDFHPDNVTFPAHGPGVTHIDPETRRVILPPTAEEIDAANQGASTTACDDQWGEERPDDAEPGECLGGLEYPPGAEQLQEGSTEDRVEKARIDADLWRGLDALLTIGDLRNHHDRELQLDLRELLMGLGVRAVDAAMALPDGDPRRDDLGELGKACRTLSTILKTTLIVPGQASAEESA